MKERHLALVVEDHSETSEDLVQILESIDCASVVVDNAEDAEKQLQEKSFCLVLLDLEIKRAPDSIKGHIEHGKSVLRELSVGLRKSETVALGDPVMPVRDCFGG